MDQLEDVPPQVSFESVLVEDRDATLEKGEFVGREVTVIIIKPAGSKDKIERYYSDWLAQKKADVVSGRFPQEWLRVIQESYKAFMNGTPAPTYGTPIKTWKHAPEHMKKVCAAVGITTVEELASANESTITRLGMGARDLKNKAEKYVRQERIPDPLPASIDELTQSTKTPVKLPEAAKSK